MPTRSEPGATPGGCATTGSTRAAIGATGMGDLQRFLAASDATGQLPPDRAVDERPARRSPPRRGRRARGPPGDARPGRRALVAQRLGHPGRAREPGRAAPGRGRGDPGHAQRRPRLGLAHRTTTRLTPIAHRRRRRAQALVRLPEHLRRPRRGARGSIERRRGRSAATTCRQPTSRVARSPARSRATPSPGACCSSSGGRPDPLTESERELIRVAATSVGNIIRAATSAADVAHQLQRADALRRVTGDIGSRLDLDEILDRLVDHAQVLFAADRVAAFLFEEDGTRRMAASRGLSRSWITAVTTVEGTTLGTAAITARRPMFSVHYRDDPRAGNLRAAVVQEGFDTVCIAPLLDGDDPEPLGHPRRRTTTSRTPGPRTSSRPWRRSRRRRTVAIKAAAELRPARDVGGPAPVDPAARHAAQPADQRQGDRRGDRDRASPAHRLPQRPGLPAVRRGPRCRWRCRAASASTRTRRRSS